MVWLFEYMQKTPLRYKLLGERLAVLEGSAHVGMYYLVCAIHGLKANVIINDEYTIIAPSATCPNQRELICVHSKSRRICYVGDD